jgi:hypothetical protein
MEAVAICARAIRAGEAELMIAGGVESMTRAPFVMPKADTAFSRASNAVYDTTLGWRFVNARRLKASTVSIRCRKPQRTSRPSSTSPRRPGRLCAALAAALRRGAGARLLCRRNRRGHCSGQEGGDT